MQLLGKVTKETDLQERLENVAELQFLMDDLRGRIAPLHPDSGPGQLNAAAWHDILHSRVQQMESVLQRWQLVPERYTLTSWMEAKHEMRLLYKIAAGLLQSGDWNSPAVSMPNGTLREKGWLQQEEDTYMRTGGSEVLKQVERHWLAELYRIPPAMSHTTFGYLTTSGLKALEIALLLFQAVTHRSEPVYYQDGLYFEAEMVVKNLIPSAVSLQAEEICGLLRCHEDIGCLIIDPSTTWPIKPAVSQKQFLQVLREYKPQRQAFIVIDRTMTSLFNQPLEEVGSFSSKVALVSFESGIKYLQHGLDMANLGLLVVSGMIMRMKTYQQLVSDLMSIFSGYPDPGVVMRLPTVYAKQVHRRLCRMTRNTHWLADMLRRFQEQGPVVRVNVCVEPEQGFFAGDLPWIGSMVYFQLKGMQTVDDYQQWLRRLVVGAPADLQLQIGGSFGFDSIRFCVVENKQSDEGEVGVRVSVGVDTAFDMQQKLMYISDFLTRKEQLS